MKVTGNYKPRTMQEKQRQILFFLEKVVFLVAVPPQAPGLKGSESEYQERLTALASRASASARWSHTQSSFVARAPLEETRSLAAARPNPARLHKKGFVPAGERQLCF